MEGEFHNFPPMFTLQPVEATREKQLQVWRRLVLDWYTKNAQESILVLDNFALFENKAIDRKLDAQGRLAVANDLIESGHGQWQTEGKTMYIFVKSPSQVAADIWEFISKNGLSGTIYTLYEIHSGDLTRNTSIQGLEAALCLQAVQVLERSGKAQIFHSEESLDETGVKFI